MLDAVMRLGLEAGSMGEIYDTYLDILLAT